MGLADPVSMSYIRAPRLHQSTARLCPLRTRISGALGGARADLSGWGAKTDPSPNSPPMLHPPHMYSMVPQKVWVTAPSWMDSLHSPKSVSLMCPEGYAGVSTAPREPPKIPSFSPKPTLAVEHDILWLKIPVDDPVGMQVTQSQCDFAQVETAAGLGDVVSDVKVPTSSTPTTTSLPGSVLQEDPFPLQLHEELSTCIESPRGTVLSHPWTLFHHPGNI